MSQTKSQSKIAAKFNAKKFNLYIGMKGQA